MGSFTAVIATLACAKCGDAYEGEVQFKTGKDSRMETFSEFDTAPLIPPGTYSGIADAFCDACRVRWLAHERRLNFDALADAVACGEAVVRRGRIVRDGVMPLRDGRGDVLVASFDDRALTPAEISAVGRQPIPPSLVFESFEGQLDEHDYVIYVGDERVHPTRLVPGRSWFDHHREFIETRLIAAGWPEGYDTWIELDVIVEADHVVRLDRREAAD